MRRVTDYFFATIVILCQTYIVRAPPPLLRARLFVKPSDYPDDLKNSGQSTRNVYYYVRMLFAHKMQTWLRLRDEGQSNGQADPISILPVPFPEETVYVLNAAFTYLLHQQRKGHVRIDNLAAAFFYLCDLERMVDPDAASRDENVADNFVHILEILQIITQVVDVHKENDLLAKLIDNVQSVNVTSLPRWYSVTVPLMKNYWVFAVDETDGDDGSMIRNGALEKLSDWYFNVVQGGGYDEAETDLGKVTESHLTFLGKIVPEIFGLVYNHLDLLIELRKHEVAVADVVRCVKTFSNFTSRMVSVFMNRYFEFKRKNGASFFRAIRPAIAFFEGGGADGEFSVWSFFFSHEDTRKHEARVRMAMDQFLELLLREFGNAVTVGVWWEKQRVLKVQYPKGGGGDGNANKQTLLDLIVGNAEDAKGILKTFCAHFLDGNKLQYKFGINLIQTIDLSLDDL